MSEKYKIVIVTVVDGDGNLLMIRRVRNHGDDNSGKWEFPAGHIDGGERPEIAAVREVFEETGLEIYLMPWSIDLPTKAGKAAQFLGFVANGDIKPEPDLAEDEHDRHIWVKAKSLSKVKPTHKNMGENLAKLLKKAKIGLNGEPLERSASRRRKAAFYEGRAWLVSPQGKVISCGQDHATFIEKNNELFHGMGEDPHEICASLVENGWMMVGMLERFLSADCRDLTKSHFDVLHDMALKLNVNSVDIIFSFNDENEFKFSREEFITFNSPADVKREGLRFRAGWRVGSAETGQSFSGKLYRGVETDPVKARKDRTPSQFAVGEHWTDNPEIAETYGSEVIGRDITLNNPYVLTLGEKEYFTELKQEFGTLRPEEITKKLKREGYDSLIVKNVPVHRRKPNGEYVVMRNSTEYILFNKRNSHRRQANQLLPTRMVRHLPEPSDDLREAILVGDEVEIFLRDQVSRGDDSAPEVNGIVDRRNRNTLWIRPLEEDEESGTKVKSPLTWKNDGDWAFIRVYRDPDQVIHYVKGNPYDPDGKTVERAKGIGLILETNPPDRFESVFALMRNETPDLDRSMGQAPESFDEIALFHKPRPGIPPILHRVREVLRDSGLEPDLVDHVGNGRVLILTQDSDLKKDIVRVLQKGGVEVTAGRRGNLIATEGRRRLATGVGGTTTIPIETDDELMRSTVVQREQKLKRERERQAQSSTGQAVTNPSQAFTPNPSITIENPMTQVKGLQKYGKTETLPGNQGIKMTFLDDSKMQQFQNDMKNNPMFKFTQTASRRGKRRAACGLIKGFRRAMRQGDYGSAMDFLGRLSSIGIREESIVKSRLASREEWAELSHHAMGVGEVRFARLSRRASRLAVVE